MKLKKKIVISMILTICLLVITTNVQAASWFENLIVKASNLFLSQTLGASVGDTFTSPVTVGGEEYAITYKITDVTNKYVEISDCEIKIPGDLILTNTITNTADGVTYTITSIGDEAFRNCRYLTSIEIPSGVLNIGVSAFYGCTELTQIIIPEGVEYIGESAFYFCKNLTEITIPRTVISIGDYAFEVCNSLSQITVDTNNTEYSSQDGVLFNKSKTDLLKYPEANSRTSYTIPQGVILIYYNAFNNCDNLTSISMPDTVEWIERNGFNDCDKLINVGLSENLISIGYGAFLRL